MRDWEACGPATDHVAVEELLVRRGWRRCGAGDWAIAVASPDRELVARISPFDPTGPMTAELYRAAEGTGLVPRLVDHRRLEGGGDLLVMEHLLPVPADVASAWLADVTAAAGAHAELAAILRRIHAEGRARLPWCGPLDTNPANVMRRHDGRLVLTDPFYADGPNLYRTALERPDVVARSIPAHERRHLAEIPLASSGPWAPGEQERVRAGLAAADARIAASGGTG